MILNLSCCEGNKEESTICLHKRKKSQVIMSNNVSVKEGERILLKNDFM